MTQAAARHILVENEEFCAQLKEQIAQISRHSLKNTLPVLPENGAVISDPSIQAKWFRSLTRLCLAQQSTKFRVR